MTYNLVDRNLDHMEKNRRQQLMLQQELLQVQVLPRPQESPTAIRLRVALPLRNVHLEDLTPKIVSVELGETQEQEPRIHMIGQSSTLAVSHAC